MEAQIFSKETLVNGFVEIIKMIYEAVNKKEKRQKLTKALIAIRKACIATEIFINSTGYETNPELVDLWHNALDKCIEAEMRGEIPDYLYSKAEFWGSPREWIDNPVTLELVPKLDYLKRECDNLLNQINS